ncbi:type I-E CRISPR-associated protein Cas6/Cse3/CasE [Streptomyces sp. 8L]|uniref:type I-E CRISPR-associated protein Cas6/Cse3/CasE n=1 Tax=Streptomyces sp. 8L TaxID=2877242 RepID=UPI001CD6329A|nr:type I-E CRISPR-associated protein Cas6/Cse3/CasE [Streptomyces sp. 8L]MCA1222560.1 type I-E CRISPR-associated protein Cas6/Cse3/CasE [Streptomyces sp. 8L]
MTASHDTPSTGKPLTLWRSRLDLAPRTQTACVNVDQLHRFVLAGFTPAPGEERMPVLYAAQRATASRSQATPRRAGRPQKILVQSLAQPDWSRLEQDGLITSTATQQVQQHYRAGEPVEIRIIANPAFRERTTGKRRAHTGTADHTRWLSRRLHDNGLDTDPERVVPSAPATVTGQKKDGHRIHVAVCAFMAQGTVLDPGLFHRALTHGVGQGKAYGCGLLLTRRLL